MVNQDYLPYAILLSISELIIIIIIVLYYYYKQYLIKKSTITASSSSNDLLSYWESYFYGLSFEYTYRSRFQSYGSIILLIIRFIIFLYFISIGFFYNYIQSKGSNAKYFTLWNINMIVTYFCFAFICSIIGFYYDTSIQEDNKPSSRQLSLHRHSIINNKWSRNIQYFGFFVQILFETMGSTALFITIIVFLIISKDVNLFNFTDHLITTLCYLIDMIFNNLIIRYEHLLFTLVWACFYLLFIWPTVASGEINQWPYEFLDTSTILSLGIYTSLLISLIIFYYIWYGIYLIKEYYGKFLYHDEQSNHQQQQQSNELNLALSTASNPLSGQILAEVRETIPGDFDII